MLGPLLGERCFDIRVGIAAVVPGSGLVSLLVDMAGKKEGLRGLSLRGCCYGRRHRRERVPDEWS
jgi:hypothetical protein